MKIEVLEKKENAEKEISKILGTEFSKEVIELNAQWKLLCSMEKQLREKPFIGLGGLVLVMNEKVKITNKLSGLMK